MGVPAFFRWLCRKYPSIVMQCAEEKPKQNVVTNEKIPVDTSQPNPSGIEFDNLYLDMNGIIHPCTHPEDRPAPKNEDEMMVIIFEFIDRIFSIVRPRKLLYMAIDGVAPRAKMNQQRSRRFRAAKDNSEKANEIKRLKDQIISNGGTVPPEVPQSEKFDSNCITPGTPFMHKLADCLRYYIHDRLNNDPGWKNICVILSDANVPGEGEHKIMDYIRRQRAQPDHDPNTHHVLCGADADLIMLGLATHEPHFSIIREEFKPDKPRPCEICNQFGHDTKECTGLTREKSGAHDEMANSFTPSEQQYIFLRLSILREYLNKELFLPNLPFKFDIERAIDDWVFMCFFVGNDFLPHLPSLEIRENAIDRLVNLYKNMINEAGGYLTDCGDVNLSRVQFILTGIGEVEDDIFKKRQRNEAEFKQRQKEKKKRMRMGQDLPSHMPSWMKSGPYAPTPLGKKVNPIKTDNKFEKLEMKEVIEVETIILNTETDADDEEKRGIKRKHPIEAANDATTSKLEPDPEPKRKPSETEATEPEVVEIEKVSPEEEEEDDESNDPVRLWEDGWKQRYYKVKFDVSEDDIDFRRKVARHYAIGLQWVLKYYYQGVPSWGWYFPYHYAPFASDFVDINDAITDFDIPSQPFNPFEQLMAVFPAASKKHVPEQWQILMTDPESPIIDFYPEDFAIDLNGKKQSWQGVALLPFVDEKRLMKAIEPLYEKLDAEQRKRNTRGNDRIFVRKSHSLYDSLKDLYNQTDMDKKYRKLKEAIDIETSISSGIAGKVWCDEYVVLENEVVRSPLRFCCPDLMHNQVVSVHYHDPMYDAEYVFNTLILEGAIIPDPTLKPEDFDNNNRYRPNLGFNRNNDYRNNKNPSVANRMIQNSMNSEMMSSAFTGQNSVYGAYKTSASFSTYSNNNQQQQNRGGYNNNNYNNNGRNYNNNRNNYNNSYNNNQGGGGGAGNSGGNYNNNYNSNVGTGGGGGNNGGGNNYNNNSRNGNYNNNNNYRNNNNNNGGYNNRNNYNNNNNNANNTNQRFPDNVNNNNFQANTGNNVNNGNPSNSNQQRQYNNRQQTTNPK